MLRVTTLTVTVVMLRRRRRRDVQTELNNKYS